MEQKRVLSAIQPTGEMHLGNYFGAIERWVELQNNHECFYGIVNYHAMTMPYKPKKLQENTWNMVLDLLATGIKPEHLFIQSLVPEHTELNWILHCFCSYGELGRMTQFKDKSQQADTKDSYISAGLFSYPVLQAADILMYKADFVPVGRDQDQHLELTRNIAQRFNHQVGKEYFQLPEVMYSDTPKLLSTADPSRKMSKSAGPKHFISLFAKTKEIQRQIRSAVTDTGETTAGTMSPGVQNLFQLLKACKAAEAHDSLMQDYENQRLKYVDLKAAVTEALIDFTQPMVQRREDLQSRRKEVKDQIKASSAEIRKVAQTTLKEVKQLTGLMNPR
jgi:tryptophanyl-tRNA synthetase